MMLQTTRSGPGVASTGLPARTEPRALANRATPGLALGLGWLGIGLGIGEAIAPRKLSRLIGVRDGAACRLTMRLLGVRELANGIAILAGRRRTPWLWMRVAGDAIDLALLGVVAGSKRRRVGWLGLGIAGAAVLGVTALDVVAAQRSARAATPPDPHAGDQEVTRVITIHRPPQDVYALWRHLPNLARFMTHIESIQVIDAKRSHWRVTAPAGSTVEWDAEIVEDLANECISWRSVAGSEIESSGTVRFVQAPGGRGTEVHVRMRYAAPAGALGVAIAKLLGEEPGQQIADDLRHFKQVLETGDIVLSDASLHRGTHAARPCTAAERKEVLR